MFDFSLTELLVIAVVALIAIGPKELPTVLYQAGKWFGRVRQLTGEFQGYFRDMMEEAELADLRRQAELARDLTKPQSIAELIDPGGTIQRSLDPADTGAIGYLGSQGEGDVSPPTIVVPDTKPVLVELPENQADRQG
ncbi:MAG: Sec-independent protein translocase protein TatB [Rhodospirillaceae bacterium]